MPLLGAALGLKLSNPEHQVPLLSGGVLDNLFASPLGPVWVESQLDPSNPTHLRQVRDRATAALARDGGRPAVLSWLAEDGFHPGHVREIEDLRRQTGLDVRLL